MNYNKNGYSLIKLKEMYTGSEKEKIKVYNTIKENNIDVLIDKELAYLHIQYCIDSGYYEEGMDLGGQAIKKYPNDTDIEKIAGLTLKNNYEAKANRYNQEKRNSGFLDNHCCDVCTSCDCFGMCDVCIDFGGADTGCCDIGDFCFCDC